MTTYAIKETSLDESIQRTDFRKVLEIFKNFLM